jgi:hypothetical protein
MRSERKETKEMSMQNAPSLEAKTQAHLKALAAEYLRRRLSHLQTQAEH